MSAWTEAVTRHRWTGDEDCRCACGEDVGNDHSWSLHLFRKLREAGIDIQSSCPVTVNYPDGAQLVSARRSF